MDRFISNIFFRKNCVNSVCDEFNKLQNNFQKNILEIIFSGNKNQFY